MLKKNPRYISKSKLKLFSVLLFLCIISYGFANNNPVVTISDGCIIKFGGKFYAMGTGTTGNIYWSDDMLVWNGPSLVAKTDKALWPSADNVYYRVGAGDLVNHNGIFHIYYNGIGHSVSTRPTNMFVETSINTAFTPDDIDPQLFIDKDGTPIFIKKVQTYNPLTGASLGTPPQTWQFPLVTPFSFGANPITGDKQGKFLNSGVKGGNDNIDKSNFEGPELYNYRDNYYLLNSTNCMSARTGLYNAFCTQATSLSTMNNSSKLPVPVLERNLEKFHRQYKVIAAFSEWGAWQGKMISSTPASNWNAKDFDDTAWSILPMGIGAPKQDRSVDIRHVRTLWDSSWSTIYVRREFTANEIPVKPFLLYKCEGNFEYYLNGTLLFADNGNYIGWRTKEIPASVFLTGKNVLAVKCVATNTNRYFDAGVYDAGNLKVEQPVMGPSQTNLLLGKNGFEHFIVYKAFWNGTSGQGVDRVFFQGKNLTTDGPTTAASNGYHPAPSNPSLFTGFDAIPDTKYWKYDAQSWTYGLGKAKLNTNNAVILSKTTATNYFLEASFALPSSGTESAGLMVWYENENNYLEILISRSTNKWIVKSMNNGLLSQTENTLPDKFLFFEPNSFVTETTPAMHELKIYKNDKRIDVWMDHFLLTIDSPIFVDSQNQGYCGISANGKGIEFEHIAYTKGWDEHSANITGWEGANSAWMLSKDGISLINNTGSPEILYKGDKIPNQNFEINISNPTLPTSGKVVLYPIYTDANNYLEATLDYQQKTWNISGKLNGTSIDNKSYSSQNKIISVQTVTSEQTTPQTVYTYNLKSENIISEMNVLWMEGAYPFISANFDLPTSCKIQYLNGSTWSDVQNVVAAQQEFSIYNSIKFDPIKTTALRLTVVPPTSKNSRPYNIELTVDLSSTFFFRSNRDGNKTYLFYNNDLLTTVDGNFPAAQVAFGTNIQNCTFDGIMCYQNGEISDGEISAITRIVTPINSNFNAYFVDENLVVDTTDFNQYNIELFDILGKLAWQGHKFVGRSISNISHLNKSVYIVSIQNDFSQSYVRKLILN